MRFTSRLVATSRAASNGSIALRNTSLCLCLSVSLSLFTCMRVGAPASVHTNAYVCERAYVCVDACMRACVRLHQCLYRNVRVPVSLTYLTIPTLNRPHGKLGWLSGESQRPPNRATQWWELMCSPTLVQLASRSFVSYAGTTS